ncbi:MAG: hypothetical protein Q8N26_32045 [Myxococcales bacterium]|nr:hypothetical protein [Myxococcales bacterium]
MSACTVVLNQPDDLETGARFVVMSALRVPFCPDDLENGARVAAMQSDAGVIR